MSYQLRHCILANIYSGAQEIEATYYFICKLIDVRKYIRQGDRDDAQEITAF